MCTSQKEIDFCQLLEIDLCAISQPFRRFRLGVRQKSEIESRHHLPTDLFSAPQALREGGNDLEIRRQHVPGWG